MKKNKIRFNIIDALILVLVLAVALVGWKLFFASDDAAAPETKEIHYVVRCTEVETAAAAKPELGSNAMNSATSVYLGTVAGCESEPYLEPAYDAASGGYLLGEVEGLSTVYLEVAGQGTETDTAITVEGTVVRVGDKIDIKCRGFAATGYIVEIFTDSSEWGE